MFILWQHIYQNHQILVLKNYNLDTILRLPKMQLWSQIWTCQMHKNNIIMWSVFFFYLINKRMCSSVHCHLLLSALIQCSVRCARQWKRSGFYDLRAEEQRVTCFTVSLHISLASYCSCQQAAHSDKKKMNCDNTGWECSLQGDNKLLNILDLTF